MGKCLSISFRNSFPMLFLSTTLNGGLKNISSLRFLLLGFFFRSTSGCFFSYFSEFLWPLVFSALSYSTFASLKMVSLDEMALRRLFTETGIWVNTLLGWLDLVLTYTVWSLGLRNGL